jgi:hypothetical protein
MKLANAPSASPHVEEMLAADAQAAAQGDAPPDIVACPLATKHETRPAPEPRSIRILSWNITELGGGFWMPRRRPSYCTDAYAAAIGALAPDVCVLMGLRKGPPFAHERLAVKERVYGWRARPLDQEAGVAEAKAILAALREVDPGADWRAAFPRAGDGSTAYVRGGTACFLYAAGRQITCKGIDVVEGAAAQALGIPELLAAGRFGMPLLAGSSPLEVGVAAPLVILRGDERASAAGRDPAPPPPTTPKATGDIPDPCVVAVSAEEDLVAQLGALNGYRSELDVQYQALADAGTVMTVHHWERIARRGPALVDNLLAVHPADVRLADRRMHWEALALPEHADDYGDVVGQLSDLLLLRDQAAEHALALENMRVVDLLRAALEPEEAKRLRVDGTPRDEDGALAAARGKHLEATARSTRAQGSGDADAANTIAGCVEFLRLLSNHWPIYTELSAKG